MVAVIETTLVKWGNSQGFRVSREACELLGVELGAKAEMRVDSDTSQLVITFEQPERKFHRTRKVTIEKVFEEYVGDYEAPSDWPASGNEIDWGEPAGKEVW